MIENGKLEEKEKKQLRDENEEINYDEHSTDVKLSEYYDNDVLQLPSDFELKVGI